MSNKTSQEAGPQNAGDSYKNFDIRRGMICHEDVQINHRVTVTLSTQALLFTSVSVALFSGCPAQHSDKVSHFVYLLGICGIVFAMIMLRAIKAARDEQELIKAEGSAADKKAELEKYKDAFPCDDKLEKALQATSGRTLVGGYSYSLAVPIGIVLIWAILLVGVWTGFF